MCWSLQHVARRGGETGVPLGMGVPGVSGVLHPQPCHHRAVWQWPSPACHPDDLGAHPEDMLQRPQCPPGASPPAPLLVLPGSLLQAIA